jgi:hypothetical protein
MARTCFHVMPAAGDLHHWRTSPHYRGGQGGCRRRVLQDNVCHHPWLNASENDPRLKTSVPIWPIPLSLLVAVDFYDNL